MNSEQNGPRCSFVYGIDKRRNRIKSLIAWVWVNVGLSNRDQDSHGLC